MTKRNAEIAWTQTNKVKIVRYLFIFFLEIDVRSNYGCFTKLRPYFYRKISPSNLSQRWFTLQITVTLHLHFYEALQQFYIDISECEGHTMVLKSCFVSLLVK